jgi:hypothetical protein
MQTKILDFLRSRTFFWAIMALFIIESSWIAFSAIYPMVFDENTHFGIIQLYSHRLNPLWFHQPENTSWAGALTRDPSYLYHYLMSFPYRLIAAITHDQMVQVIFLRFINIALFGTGLILFRRLLLKTKASPAIVHVALLFFILTPVVPLLAGQINYDNLIMPLVALTLLLASDISSSLRKLTLPIGKVLILASVGMLSSLVQFMFLPILAGIFLWFGWQAWPIVRKQRRSLPDQARSNWQKTAWTKRLLIGLPLMLALGLFIQMYGVNVVKYHNLTPQCDQVMSRADCADFGPWARNQEVLANKHAINPNPVLYGASWTYRMFVASFFTSSGGGNTGTMYLSINPLPVIFISALLLFSGGVVLLILYRRDVFAGYEHMGLLLFVCLIYGGSLWLRNYHDYVQLGEKIAIQGRYIFPIALPCMIIIALAFRQLFGHRTHLKVALAGAAFVLFLQGGGALTYILNSNESWYWQNNGIARLNHATQALVKPLVVVKKPISAFGASTAN